jgi:hypothetical protein
LTTTNPSEKIAKVDRLYDEVNKGQTAEAILRVLNPLVDARLGQLLAGFEKSPPELGPLLDLRARISELWRIRRTLDDLRKIGISAQGILEAVMEKSTSGNRT